MCFHTERRGQGTIICMYRYTRVKLHCFKNIVLIEDEVYIQTTEQSDFLSSSLVGTPLTLMADINPRCVSHSIYVQFRWGCYCGGSKAKQHCKQRTENYWVSGLAPSFGIINTRKHNNNTEAVYFLLHNIYKFSSYLTGNTIHLRCVARNSDH
jgi:hypothetical protein